MALRFPVTISCVVRAHTLCVCVCIFVEREFLDQTDMTEKIRSFLCAYGPLAME